MTKTNSINEVLSNNYGPSTLVVIATYKCTASCKSCCFGCSPKKPLGTDIGKIRRFIDSGTGEFPSLKLAVFTGGECFLLGTGLDEIIAYAKSKGLYTRCVTNGFWAKSPAIATERLKALKNAGLTEINFSAGFAHQAFVPSEHVLNGAMAAAQLGMVALISVENDAERKNCGEMLAKHPLLLQFMKDQPEQAKLVKIIDTVWVGDGASKGGGKSKTKPCDTILDTLVLTPDFRLKSCCGLSVDSIPEMDMGAVEPGTLRARHTEQFDDFLKIWMKVDGPEGIIGYLKEKHPDVKTPEFSHPCQACKFLYSSQKIRDLIREHFVGKSADVLFRFSTVKEVTGRVNNLIGYGA